MKFKSLATSKSFPEMEDDLIQFWNDNKIFEKSVNQRDAENSYVFYDGPPFISGLPHYGHLLGSIAKDLIPRYWAMKGKRVERVWGWDAHGLTVENKVQKEHGIKGRREIEEFGLEKFTEACYEYTSKVSGEWKWYIDKIARWVDLDNAYKTIDKNYMESVIWAFKELYEKDLIYEGTRTSLFCTTCGTPISNFEVAMDNSYKDMNDPAITVKFEVTSEGKFKEMYILAWTTTPWTIPSNRALVLDPKETYVLVESEGSKYILAKKRLALVFIETDYVEQETILGADLLGLKYKPPFNLVKANDAEYKVYEYEDMVNMEEGTGIVHSAPGYGEIDSQMGNHYGLNLMKIVNDEGHYRNPSEVGLEEADENPYIGMFYKKADKYITEDLAKMGLLFKKEVITHRFPYHDRCDTPLIQTAQKSWFIRVSELKNRMLKHNQEIKWVPEHLKDGRFGKGIEQAPDWCISRNRYWATPMPVWQSEDGDRIVIGSVKELEDLSGQEIRDLHRPYIDEVKFIKDGKEYTRIPEVLDCWMESGSMSFAQFHYPFENKEKFERDYPGDYIVEYIAQTRAWFYVMHVMSTALFDSKSFKNVVTTGVMAGNDGRKMSKTYGNYTDPKELLEKIGGDALRLYLMGSPLMVGENANFDEEEIKNKVRNFLFPLWNTFKFFLIYAEINNWESSEIIESDNELDKWVLARLEQTLINFSNSIEEYNTPSSVRPVEEFVIDLSQWYIRRSRDRFAKGDKSAFSTLYKVLTRLSIGIAPLVPFVTESIYKTLSNEKESVHLEDYPKLSEIDDNSQSLIEEMQEVRNIVSLALASRIELGIKIKQPLSSVAVNRSDLDDWAKNLIMEEVNVKSVEFTETGPGDALIVKLDTEITEVLREEGMLRELLRHVQSARKDAGLKVGENAVLNYNSDEEKLINLIDRNSEVISRVTNTSQVNDPSLDSVKFKVGDYIITLSITKK